MNVLPTSMAHFVIEGLEQQQQQHPPRGAGAAVGGAPLLLIDYEPQVSWTTVRQPRRAVSCRFGLRIKRASAPYSTFSLRYANAGTDLMNGNLYCRHNNTLFLFLLLFLLLLPVRLHGC